MNGSFLPLKHRYSKIYRELVSDTYMILIHLDAWEIHVRYVKWSIWIIYLFFFLYTGVPFPKQKPISSTATKQCPCLALRRFPSLPLALLSNTPYPQLRLSNAHTQPCPCRLIFFPKEKHISLDYAICGLYLASLC